MPELKSSKPHFPPNVCNHNWVFLAQKFGPITKVHLDACPNCGTLRVGIYDPEYDYGVYVYIKHPVDSWLIDYERV